MAATGRAALNLDIEVQGVREVERALDALPADALVTLKRRTKEIAKELASKIQAAGRRDSRQSARAAATVRVKTNRSGATVVAGPHPLLYGSEFGAIRRFGWYAEARFDRSPRRQFRPWGQHSYWFIRTGEAERPWVDAQFRATVDDIVRGFRAG
jgi:hypothetical protein